MNKCPHCDAETRPGDQFCLSCGNRLQPASPSFQPQAQQAAYLSDATLPAQDEWLPPAQSGHTQPANDNNWPDLNMPTLAGTAAEIPTMRSETNEPTVQAAPETIEHPARIILKAENGDVVQEYTIDKPEISIGRAPNSEILLSKDKLTSRRHATIYYENNHYILRDERSANGTFVNGQQLEELAPYTLKDGDHVGIGEHELIFDANSAVDVEDMPTVNVNPSDLTFQTQRDDQLSPQTATNDNFETKADDDPEPVAVGVSANNEPAQAANEQPQEVPAQVSSPTTFSSVAPEPIASSPVPTPTTAPATSTSDSFVSAASSNAQEASRSYSNNGSTADGVTFGRLTSLPLPNLPDIAPLMAALSTLDGQVSALQEQLNTTQEAMRNHESEIAQTTNQLRTGVRRVSDRMDQTIGDVARSREAMAWSELLQLMDDVTNNPRDIEYVTKLARKARELNKVFQIHQSVLNTLAECNSLLRSLIGEER